jgi:hypothetical protein
MKKTQTLLSIIFLSVFLGCSCMNFQTYAQQSKKISLQGFLKDANGKAVPDGQQNITFKLYTTETAGTAAWTEDQNVNVFGGVYSTHLGKTVSLESLNWGANTYYVGVTVQGTELTPRTELTFAPYSLGSPKAQEVVCSGAVGDIKHSILNPTQFAAVNGSCWVPMDGRALATTDKLRQITGATSLPNGGGLFIRSQEFENSNNIDEDRNFNSPIATFQGEDFRSHAHYASLSVSGSTSGNGAHNHSHSVPLHNSTSGGRVDPGKSFSAVQGVDRALESYYSGGTGGVGDHSHSISGSASGNTNNAGNNETRPDNLNFWVYIRIN